MNAIATPTATPMLLRPHQQGEAKNNMGAVVIKVAIGAAVTSLVLGQAINVQVSGAQIVGWVVGAVGFVLCSLIALLTWFMRREFEGVKGTQGEHSATLHRQDGELKRIGSTLDDVTAWKKERQLAHERANEQQIKDLKDRLREQEKHNNGGTKK